MQPNPKTGKTPLMDAALDESECCSEKTVSALLSLGASADRTDRDDKTALMAAIQSNCITNINQLAPVTNANLGGAVYYLARYKVDVDLKIKLSD